MNEIRIEPATPADALLLARIGRQAFIESHGHSASGEDISSYADRKLSPETFARELADPQNIFRIIRVDGVAAGYSKIICNSPHPNIVQPNAAKLERLYVLDEYLPLRLGAPLLAHNIDYARAQQQSGIWLFVWTENTRAVRFYEKQGFRRAGHYDFPISETHSNPNYQMLLEL